MKRSLTSHVLSMLNSDDSACYSGISVVKWC